MKKIITAFIFCFLCGECFSQAGEWVWIKGDSIPNQPGNYGVQGVPSPTNNPPSLYEPCEWTDLNGNFWLFGGFGGAQYNGDLWKYDFSSNEWTWVKGSGISNDMGSYGIQGVSSPLNNPPSRGYGVVSWVDNQGDFWMFGGGHNAYIYNDLWKYDVSTNEWTWMKGSDIPWQPGIYGTKGIPDSANTPGARAESAAGWTDNAGDLWMFGGSGGALNDLWKYEISTNIWTWIKGDSTGFSPGLYGTIGLEDSTSTPRGMAVYCRWKDSSGRLWMYGGGHLGPYDFYGDLWRFNPLTNNWAFMGANNAGSNGIKCVASSVNSPFLRFENRAAWTDSNGNFWFFGGLVGNTSTKNDLWKYCPSNNKWIWEGGSNIPNQAGSWGVMGVSNPLNNPNAKSGSIGWKDNNDHLYLFGGLSHQGINGNYWSDLWKYTIDSTCGVCPNTTSIKENNFVDKLLVFPNPTNSSLTISFESSDKQNIELRLYNTLGKQIYFSKEEITKGKFEKEINVEKWSEGIYFLQIKTKEGNLNRKVIVNHP